MTEKNFIFLGSIFSICFSLPLASDVLWHGTFVCLAPPTSYFSSFGDVRGTILVKDGYLNDDDKIKFKVRKGKEAFNTFIIKQYQDLILNYLENDTSDPSIEFSSNNNIDYIDIEYKFQDIIRGTFITKEPRMEFSIGLFYNQTLKPGYHHESSEGCDGDSADIPEAIWVSNLPLMKYEYAGKYNLGKNLEYYQDGSEFFKTIFLFEAKAFFRYGRWFISGPGEMGIFLAGPIGETPMGHSQDFRLQLL